jgi:putative membrane protein
LMNIREAEASNVASVEVSREREGRLLIVVIDLDDDLSQVGISTPIVGYENALNAAVEFAVKRPEDSDVNALFAGLSIYRKLRSQGADVEIAVLAGHPTDLVAGQRRVLRQLDEVLEYVGEPVDVVLVSDSEYDMMIAEVLRSRVPVVALKRVVVEQHLGIETSYMLLARYLKKAVTDPRFAKYTVGIPGSLLATAALLSLFGLGGIVLKSVLALLGIAMIVHGFNLEPVIKREISWITSRPGLVLAGYVIMLMFATGSAIVAYYSISQAPTLIEGMANFFRYSILLFSIGAVGYIIIGKILYMVVNGDFDIYGEVAAIVLFLFATAAFYRLGTSLLTVQGPNLPGTLTRALLASDFLELSIIGASLAGLIELAGRSFRKRERED